MPLPELRFFLKLGVLVKAVRYCINFTRATLTKYHRLEVEATETYFSQFWRLEA